jgi:Ca2+/Na+ antiporter
MTYAATTVYLPAHYPRRAVSMDVSLSVPAVLLHQGSLSIYSSVLLLLHLINYLLLLLAQIRVVPCHYIKL